LVASSLDLSAWCLLAPLLVAGGVLAFTCNWYSAALSYYLEDVSYSEWRAGLCTPLCFENLWFLQAS
jgi:hypothetical protein